MVLNYQNLTQRDPLSSNMVVQGSRDRIGKHTPLLQGSAGADVPENIDEGKDDSHSKPRFFVLIEIGE
jgi:hypothetical protein